MKISNCGIKFECTEDTVHSWLGFTVVISRTMIGQLISLKYAHSFTRKTQNKWLHSCLSDKENK